MRLVASEMGSMCCEIVIIQYLWLEALTDIYSRVHTRISTHFWSRTS